MPESPLLDASDSDDEPLARVLARLTNLVARGDAWVARCPAHEDARPSLSVRAKTDGQVLLHCHAGCQPEAVVAALGLELANLFPARHRSEPQRRILATYDYRDEAGTLLDQICRFDPKDFRARRPTGSSWDWSLRGVRRVPYRLPELLASESANLVLIVEGEKDVDRLAMLGFVSTTNDGGAGKWRPEFATILAGHPVAVVPDNDASGRASAEQIANSLVGMASSVCVVELPGMPLKGDVSDWLDRGGTREGLIELISSAPRGFVLPT